MSIVTKFTWDSNSLEGETRAVLTLFSTGVQGPKGEKGDPGEAGGGAVASIFGRSGVVVAQSGDYTKAQVGLGNVDNTPDVSKPISSATQAALDSKAPISTTVNGHPLSANIIVTKADVGLGNVDNTSDVGKPVSTAQSNAIAASLSSAQSYADAKVTDSLGSSTTVAPSQNAVTSGLSSKGNLSDVQNLLQWNEETWSTGLVSGGVITPTNGTGGFSVSAGVGYRKDGTNPIRRVVWGTLSGVSIYEGINFIYITDDGFGVGSIHITATPDLDNVYISLGAIQVNGGVLSGFSSVPTVPVSDFYRRVAEFAGNTFGVMVLSGCTCAEGATPLSIERSAGEITHNLMKFSVPSGNTFTKMMVTADYGLIPETSTTANRITVGYYNNVANNAASALVAMTSGWWKKDYLLCTVEGAMFLLYAQTQYATEQLARDAAIPVLPPELSNGLLSLISVVSTTNTTSVADGIIDIRPYMPRIFGTGDAAAPSSVTTLVGDVVGSGAGTISTSLATIIAGATKGSASKSITATVDQHGRVTAVSDADIQLAQSQVTSLTSDLAAKEPTISAGTTSQYWRGDKSWQTLSKSTIGLSNVDNTSDAGKPISTATQTALDLKVDENAAIVGATKTKVTYDAKGLVTAGVDATTADIADSTNKRYVTDAQLTVIGNTSGTNTGDQDISGLMVKANNLSDLTNAGTARTNLGLGSLATQSGTFSGTSSGTNTGDETATSVGALVNGATGKTTPVDADSIGLVDSAASNILKKLTWSNIKATLKTYFDTLYIAVGGNSGTATALQTARNINGVSFNGTSDINITVSNAMLSTVSTATFKGRTTAGTGVPEDLSVSQATALLNSFVGDSGSGGTKGLVPAPTTGDATKYLKGDGTWGAVAGSGTVTDVSITSANGVSGSVANSTTTPAITLALGAITPTSVAASGTISGSNLSLGSTLTITGGNLTLTQGGVTNVTLPNSGRMSNYGVAYVLGNNLTGF